MDSEIKVSQCQQVGITEVQFRSLSQYVISTVTHGCIFLTKVFIFPISNPNLTKFDFYCRFGPLYSPIPENKRKKYIKLVKSAAGEAYTSRFSFSNTAPPPKQFLSRIYTHAHGTWHMHICVCMILGLAAQIAPATYPPKPLCGSYIICIIYIY